MAVARDAGVGIGGEQSVVLASDFPPLRADMRHGAASVREERAQAVVEHLHAVEDAAHRRRGSARFGKEAEADGKTSAALFAGNVHLGAEPAAPLRRAVRLARHEHREIAAPGAFASGCAGHHLADGGLRHAAEGMFGAHDDEMAGRHHDDARDVVGQRDFGGGRHGARTRDRREQRQRIVRQQRGQAVDVLLRAERPPARQRLAHRERGRAERLAAHGVEHERRRLGELRREGVRRGRRFGQAEDFARLQNHRTKTGFGLRQIADCAAEQIADVARAAEFMCRPGDRLAAPVVQIREHEQRSRRRLAWRSPNDGEGIAVAPLHEPHVGARAEGRVRGEQRVEPRENRDLVLGGAPAQRARAMHVDLLVGEPLDAIGDAEAALMGEHRRHGDAHPGVRLRTRREAVVVVRLGEVDERPRLGGHGEGAGQIAFERGAVLGLEDFGIGPVETFFGEERPGDGELAAEPFEQEHRVRELLTHAGHDVAPDLAGHHVAGVAAKAVHALAAPEFKNPRHETAQARVRVVQLD